MLLIRNIVCSFEIFIWICTKLGYRFVALLPCGTGPITLTKKTLFNRRVSCCTLNLNEIWMCCCSILFKTFYSDWNVQSRCCTNILLDRIQNVNIPWSSSCISLLSCHWPQANGWMPFYILESSTLYVLHCEIGKTQSFAGI